MSKSLELYNRDKKSLSDVMKLRFCPFVAESGEGAILKDPDGKEYLDFSAGWGVVNTGYNHPAIVKAVSEQMKKLSFASTISVMNQESVELAEKLIDITPGDFEKSVWFGHSGSDANEFVSKIVPLVTGRSRIITFVGSYHGQTMGSYAMSGHPSQSRFIGGGNIVKLPYPYCYRCAFEKERNSCDLFCLRYIEKYVFDSVTDPEQVGAIVIEAVQCDGGDVVPAKGFLKGLETLCKKHGILLIIDEVKIGFGRTGKMFGFEHFDIVPDAVIMAKPMASGQPLSAVVGRKDLLDAGVGMHLFTTAGNPVACRAAIETIRIIEEEKLISNALSMGKYIVKELNTIKDELPVIGDIRGKGLVIGVELVSDRKTKKPASDFAALVVYRAYELGLIIYDSGINSNVLELTPPLIITKEQADQAIKIIKQAILDVRDEKIKMEEISDFAGWSS
ncbi:MAG: aspartate aminotransferase family protein [Lentihominibacter sp.]